MKLIKNITSFLIIILLVGLNISVHAGAQASNANAAQGMQISPALVELNALKGKSYNITVNILNVTASNLVFNSSVNDFSAADESGSPKIDIDSSLPKTASIRSWVETVPQFSLKARESRNVTAQITIPTDAEPGGHYGVLRFSGTAPEIEETGVGLSASAGVLILIRVDGDITEKASLASFFSANQDGKQSSFFENSPVKFVTRINNEGNIHIKPSGNVEIRDVFGGLVKNLKINDSNPKSNVLPKSIRRFENELDKSWMFGLYTANLTLGYGTNGQAITNTINFWVIPYRIILAVLFVIFTLVFIFKRLIKVYNKRIIEKAKNENKNNSKKHHKKES